MNTKPIANSPTDIAAAAAANSPHQWRRTANVGHSAADPIAERAMISDFGLLTIDYRPLTLWTPIVSFCPSHHGEKGVRIVQMDIIATIHGRKSGHKKTILRAHSVSAGVL